MYAVCYALHWNDNELSKYFDVRGACLHVQSRLLGWKWAKVQARRPDDEKISSIVLVIAFYAFYAARWNAMLFLLPTETLYFFCFQGGIMPFFMPE